MWDRPHILERSLKWILHPESYLRSDNAHICFFSVPHGDVRRLCTLPLKRIGFVKFCNCGAHGDISPTPDGPPVNYDSPSPEGETLGHGSVLYVGVPAHPNHTSPEHIVFVDPCGLDERVTSSSQTPQ